MSKTSILVDYQKIASAIGYQTAFDMLAGKYRIIEPNGDVSDRKYLMRKNAEIAAVKLAKFKYISKNWRNDEKRAQKILGNELYEEYRTMDDVFQQSKLQSHVDSDVKLVSYDESEELED